MAGSRHRRIRRKVGLHRGTITGLAVTGVTDRCDWVWVANATWLEAINALWPFCPGYPDINTRPSAASSSAHSIDSRSTIVTAARVETGLRIATARSARCMSGRG